MRPRSAQARIPDGLPGASQRPKCQDVKTTPRRARSPSREHGTPTAVERGVARSIKGRRRGIQRRAQPLQLRRPSTSTIQNRSSFSQVA